MVRSAAAFLVMALALSWTGRGHDDSLGTQMVPITLKDRGGHTLLVSRYEVTVASWRQCYLDGGCPHMPESPAGSDNVPITGVNYIDVGKYLEWANARSRRALRLPTIAEWRAINPAPVSRETPLRFTDPRMAWAATYGQEKSPTGPPRPSGSFSATPSGIADLDGNVWERRQPILGLDWYRTSKFRIAMPAGNKNSGDRSMQVYWGGMTAPFMEGQ